MKLIRFAKTPVFLIGLISLILCQPTVGFAQDKSALSLHLPSNKITVGNLITEIEEKAGLHVIYSDLADEGNKIISFRSTDQTVRQLLQQITEQTNLHVQLSGNEVTLNLLQRGTVKGTVKTSDGQPAAYVTISIKGQRSVRTDSNGSFTLENITSGIQTILASYVGLQTQQQRINVPVNGTTEVQFILTEDAQTLQEVVVSGEHVNKFADKETEYVARMPLSNLQNPQVYSVVNQSLIKEQISVEISDIMRNATGVVPQLNPAGGMIVNFRGFSTGINARNGMETASGRSSLDIANIERVEVLKGPSGTLFGSAVSSFGGVVNLVTKKPFETAQTEVSYTNGSFDLHRLAIDINTPLKKDKSVLFRLNTAINRQESFLSYGFNNTLLLAPSLTYRMSDRATLNMDAEYFYTNNTRMVYNRFNPASGITNPRQIPLAYNKVLYFDDLDAKTNATKFFADFRYKLSDNWTSSSLFSFVGENVDHSYQYYQTWVSPTKVTREVSLYGPISNNYLNLQQNLNGKFQTGFLKHDFLAGVNYRLNTGDRVQGATGVIDTADVTKDIRDMVRKTVDSRINITADPNSVPKIEMFSAYATDVLNFTDKLSALLSLRVDHYVRARAGNTEGDKQTAFAPKLGLVYQLVKDRISVFGNYMSGFQNTASTVEQPNGTISTLDPIMAYQSEGGVKMETRDKRVNLTLSYYRILIDNATRTNPDGFTVQDGSEVSKGMDAELVVNPITGLNILMGYAYNDHRVVKASDPTIEGNWATNAPKNTANVWLSYTFQGKLKGFGLGFGGNYVDKGYGFADNVFYTPAYAIMNGTVFYQQDKWRLGFKLNNISDKQYWNFSAAPQAPRNYAINLSVKF